MLCSKLDATSQNPRFLLGWLAGLALLAIAGKLTLGTTFAILPALVMLALVPVALFSPWLGVLSLFPLAFALDSAPQSLGLREIAFGGICLALVAGALWMVYKHRTLERELRKWAPLFGVVVLFVMMNFFIARENGVPATDWVRGLIPFVFITLFWPVAVLLEKDENRVFWLAGALAVMAVLFSAQVLIVYWYEGFYKELYYLLINGEFVLVEPPLSGADTGDKLGPYFNRVTQILPQSTDALLPLTFSVAYVISVLSPSRNMRRAMFLLTCLASTSILATYTRSMLITALASVCMFGLMLLIFKRDVFMRAVLTGLAVIIVSVIIAFAINLDLMWKNRLLQLYYSLNLNVYFDSAMAIMNVVIDCRDVVLCSIFSDVATLFDNLSVDEEELAPIIPNIDLALFSSDANVLTRLEEYRIALEFYHAQPITGAGLGIRHEIVFETSTGEELVQQVGYVHNWVFYFLKVAGLPGAIAYGTLLIVPSLVLAVKLWLQREHLAAEDAAQSWMIFNALWVAFLTFVLYALFFAVFRLITFNLVLAAGLGMIVYLIRKHSKRAA